MSARDWKEVGVWAEVTVVVAVGLFGGTTAFSLREKARPAAPTAVIGDVTITASVAKIGPNQIEVTINATNPTGKVKKVVVPVSLVSREFTGSPMSRVMRPEDYTTTTLYTRNPTINVPAEGNNTLTLQFDTDVPAEVPAVLNDKPVKEIMKAGEPMDRLVEPEKMPRQISYLVEIQGDKDSLKVPVIGREASNVAQ